MLEPSENDNIVHISRDRSRLVVFEERKVSSLRDLGSQSSRSELCAALNMPFTAFKAMLTRSISMRDMRS